MSDIPTSEGRYTLTVQYDEPNPRHDSSPKTRYYGGETVFEPERLNVQVLSVVLTPAQFEMLKYETLKVWQAQLTAPLVMDK